MLWLAETRHNGILVTARSVGLRRW